MRKLIALAGVALAMLAVGVTPAAANTTDSCIEFGPGPVGAQSCFATTSETNVDFAQVNMGRYSAGSFTLVCTKYGNVYIKQGNIGTNGNRNFFIEGLFGLHNPDCSLSARAHNTSVNRRASLTVTLID
jgi:hypothetical protein